NPIRNLLSDARFLDGLNQPGHPGGVLDTPSGECQTATSNWSDHWASVSEKVWLKSLAGKVWQKKCLAEKDDRHHRVLNGRLAARRGRRHRGVRASARARQRPGRAMGKRCSG